VCVVSWLVDVLVIDVDVVGFVCVVFFEWLVVV